MAAKQLPPFPVVLDLTDDRAYGVLTIALGIFAETARGDADDEAQRESPNQSRVDDLNAIADTAERLLEDIDRQLTQTDKALS